MRTRRFGDTDQSVSIVGQGTWRMERDDRSAAVAALRRGLDLGMNHVDTAEMYGNGAVERLVGEAIAGRRDEVFLVSKVLPSNASRRGTVAACEGSLRRLATDRLDAYLLHWPGPHPLEDTIAAFEELVEDGKILSWGLSNFDADGLARAAGLAGGDRVACDQVLYHLEERAIEHRLLPYCEDQGISVVAYSPLGSGRFPSPGAAGEDVLGEIAESRAVSRYQVALAFLLRREAVFAIPKASRIDHVEENAAAAALELSREEIDRLDAAFPRGRPPSALPVI